MIEDCYLNQIHSSKNGILYCEDPICDERCKNDTATCIPKFNNNTINKIENNICQCNKGYEGTYCDKMILFKIK